MKVWISGSIEQVKAAAATGLVGAIVTNPTVMAQWTAEGRSLEEVVAEVTQAVDLPLYVQLYGPGRDEFLAEAYSLRSISTRVATKLPATQEGLVATGHLARDGIPTLVTAICSVNQAYLAACAGASTICPYVGRLQASGQDAQGLIRDVVELYRRNGVATEVIPASVRTPADVTATLLSGAHGVIIFYPVFEELFQHDVTRASLKQFEDDWKRIRYERRAAP